MSGFNDSDETYGEDNGAVVDIVNRAGAHGPLTISTTSLEAKVGVSKLQYRRSLSVYNNSNTTIYWGYSSAVTITSGTPLPPHTLTTWRIGESISVWLIASSVGNNVRVTEGA